MTGDARWSERDIPILASSHVARGVYWTRDVVVELESASCGARRSESRCPCDNDDVPRLVHEDQPLSRSGDAPCTRCRPLARVERRDRVSNLEAALHIALVHQRIICCTRWLRSGLTGQAVGVRSILIRERDGIPRGQLVCPAEVTVP